MNFLWPKKGMHIELIEDWEFTLHNTDTNAELFGNRFIYSDQFEYAFQNSYKSIDSLKADLKRSNYIELDIEPLFSDGAYTNYYIRVIRHRELPAHAKRFTLPKGTQILIESVLSERIKILIVSCPDSSIPSTAIIVDINDVKKLAFKPINF